MPVFMSEMAPVMPAIMPVRFSVTANSFTAYAVVSGRPAHSTSTMRSRLTLTKHVLAAFGMDRHAFSTRHVADNVFTMQRVAATSARNH